MDSIWFFSEGTAAYKWKTLVDSYRREKRAQNEPSGAQASTRKPWLYYDALKFIDDPTLVRPMTGNLDMPTAENEVDETGADQSQDDVLSLVDNTGLYSTGPIGNSSYYEEAAGLHGDTEDIVTEDSNRSNKKRKLPEKWSMVGHLFNTLEENKRKTLEQLQQTGVDADRQFFLSLLPYVKKVLD